MARVRCPECGTSVPNSAFICPHCEHPTWQDPPPRSGKEISVRGMVLMLLLFVGFPILVFLLQILYPDLF